MANLFAVHSVGDSLTTSLRNAYPDALRTSFPCDFRLLSSGEMANDTGSLSTTLSLFLYRITIDEYLRNAGRRNDLQDGSHPLSVDLHYLMIVWANNAEAEHTIMTWAMRQLQMRPLLDLSSLSPEGGWSAEDSVQIVPEELSTEDLMRIWDAFEAHYRLTVSYTARVVRVDTDSTPDTLPVVAARFVPSQLETVP
jgi:hypothetical protein